MVVLLAYFKCHQLGFICGLLLQLFFRFHELGSLFSRFGLYEWYCTHHPPVTISIYQSQNEELSKDLDVYESLSSKFDLAN